jgi:multicomponent Na+:H+ antiporter subunit E
LRYAISLGLTLFGGWLLLSGHYTLLITTLGVLSVVFTVVIVLRMDTCDHETHPIHLTLRGITYWPWLLWEIAKANVDVAKRVFSAGPNISPTVFKVKSSQKTELGQVIYANSITLTPGTTTMDIEGGTFVIHTIAREVGDDLSSGEMDRRVSQMEGHD